MTNFNFTKVSIIESLSPGDFKTGTELSKYIAGLKEDHPSVPNVELIEVSGRTDFLQALERLIVGAEQDGEQPILQIEMHGWSDKSGLAFPDDSSLSWPELAQPLIRLNRATGFNLIVCVSACNGGHFIDELDITQPSPCFALIGPTHETNSGELLGSFRSMYRELLTKLDGSAALKALNNHQLNQGGFLTVTAEDWFFRLADNYLNIHCTKARLNDRTNALIEQLIIEGVMLTQLDQKTIREIGEHLAFAFLERRFPSFFMLADIPNNQARFSGSLDRAKHRVKNFISNNT